MASIKYNWGITQLTMPGFMVQNFDSVTYFW